MRAAVLEETKKLVVKDIPKPEPKGSEILTKVKACGICGTDVKLYKGEYTANIPVVLGHEFSGEVIATGKEVRNIKVGDRVVVDPNESCGACNFCRTSQPTFCQNLAAYGVLRDGGFAEYVAVNEKGTYKIPPGLSFEVAAFSEPVSCAIHAIDRAGIKVGESVAIIGGGTQGQIILQLARIAGATELIMITRSAEKLDLAREFGATHLIRAGKENVKERILEITDNQGVDVVIEAVGSVETVEEAIELAKRGGKVIIFGFTPEKEKATFMPFDILSKELTIMGSWVNPYAFLRAISLLAKGKIKVEPLISKKIKLDNIMDGFKLMIEKPKGFMKAIVEP